MDERATDNIIHTDVGTEEITLENEREKVAAVKKQCERRKGYLGQTLREFRKRAGRTQAEVAKDCGISTTQYNYYEQGQYFPDTDRLLDICRHIDADPLAVFAAALNRSKEDVKSKSVSAQTFENVAKAFHKKIDEIAEDEVVLS